MPDPLTFFDRIFVINLKRRPDRLDEFMAQFKDESVLSDKNKTSIKNITNIGDDVFRFGDSRIVIMSGYMISEMGDNKTKPHKISFSSHFYDPAPIHALQAEIIAGTNKPEPTFGALQSRPGTSWLVTQCTAMDDYWIEKEGEERGIRLIIRAESMEQRGAAGREAARPTDRQGPPWACEN